MKGVGCVSGVSRVGVSRVYVKVERAAVRVGGGYVEDVG